VGLSWGAELVFGFDFFWKNFGQVSGSGLIDLAAFDALGADPNPGGGPIDDMANRLQIGLPDLLGFVIGVGNVIAVLRALSAKIAYAGHF
jgi:hypothetical protein